MKKILKNTSVFETEAKAIQLNADRWYYDSEKKEGIIIKIESN